MTVTPPVDMRQHPFAVRFTQTNEPGFIDTLADDIKAKGLLNPILWHVAEDGEPELLDGVSRLAACASAGVEPRFENVTDKVAQAGGPVLFIVSENVKRRHLSVGQRAGMAAEMPTLGKGRPSNNPSQDGFTQEEIAAATGVSPASQLRYKKVTQSGTQALKDAVDAGEIDLKVAAKIAVEPPAAQGLILQKYLDDKVTQQPGFNGSHEMEWYTPPETLDVARRFLGGFDLDPASCELANRTVGASAFYDKEQDGLSKTWKGSVWLNPPYGAKLVKPFARKLLAEYNAGNVTEALMLVNDVTDTDWFQDLVNSGCAVCFLKKRPNFHKLGVKDESGSGPSRGFAVFYFGTNRDAFAVAYADQGIVMSLVVPK